jgi:hypothetical protein
MDAFDKHIKSLIENHEVPVDTQELWMTVEPRLGKRRSYRRLLFLLLLLMALPLSYLMLTMPGKQQELVSSRSGNVNSTFFGRKGQLINQVPVADTQQTEKVQFTDHYAKAKKRAKGSDEHKSGSIVQKNNKEIQEALKENDVRAESNITTKYRSESFELLEPRSIHSTKKVATNTAIQPVISLFDHASKITATPKAINHAFRWSLDLFGGIDYTAKSLLAKNYDYRWYSQARFDTEKYIQSFNLGFQVNLEHQTGWHLGSGLVYHRIDELFESNSTKEFRTFKEGVVQIVTNADGSLTEVNGQKLVIVRKSWSKRKYNTYTFLNLPMNLGWSHSVGGFRLAYTAGIDVNLQFSQSGEIIGNEGFPVSVSEPQNSIFRNLTSVNLNGGIKLLYPLSDRIIIYAEPNIHYNLYSITDPEYPLEQRYFHSGLRIGSRIKL